MQRILASAAVAIVFTAGHPLAATVHMPVVRHTAGFALAPFAAETTESAWNGRWESTTVSGHHLILQLELQGERIGGKLTVGKQSAKITYGKVVGNAFALTTGPIDGRRVDATGRQVGDAIELTVDGVKEPITLTRVK